MQTSIWTRFLRIWMGCRTSRPNRILDSIEETLQSIAKQPYLGAAHSELTRLLGEEVRSRLVAPYRIFYRVGRSGPEILSILHGARDQRNLLTSRFTQ